MARHQCRRSNLKEHQCPAAFPESPSRWCEGCRHALESAQLAAAAEASFGIDHHPEDPPCPLDDHQVQQLLDWLASASPAVQWMEANGWPPVPGFPFETISRPSAN